MTSYVLDTSAILTVLNQEEGLETVLSLLDSAAEGQAAVYIPFMALMELEYLLLRRIGPEETQRTLALVNAWPIAAPDSDPDWRHQAAVTKAAATLSMADAGNAALTLSLDASLVHKDPEYENVAHLRMVKLPYKKSACTPERQS